MKKNRLAFYLVLSIILINISNIVFILISLRGPEQYLKQVLMIFKDYFMGFPAILFGLFIFVLLVFQLLKKSPFQKILHMSVIVFLIFIFSFNIALFPSLNRWSEFESSTILNRKTNASLNEAIRTSKASYTDIIAKYVEMNVIFYTKILVIPESNLLQDDFCFNYFVKPGNLVKKKYNFLLSNEEFAKIKKVKHRVIRAFPRTGKIYAYFIFQGVEDSSEIYMFIHRQFCLFVPGRIAEEFI